VVDVDEAEDAVLGRAGVAAGEGEHFGTHFVGVEVKLGGEER
jgi:hypothetical protein